VVGGFDHRRMRRAWMVAIMIDITERMRSAIEPLPDELLGDERSRCAFYANDLSVDDIMQLRKDTWPALDAAARDAEAARRILAA
jgi:hypothetical protein